MPAILLNKWVQMAAGIAVAVLAAFVWLASHDHKVRTAQEALDTAKYEQALADQRVQQAAHDEAENVRVSEVIKDYEKQISIPDPATVGLAVRLHKYTLSSCNVPTPQANPEGTGPSPGEPSGPTEIEQANEDLAIAAIHDASQVEGLRAAWGK